MGKHAGIQRLCMYISALRSNDGAMYLCICVCYALTHYSAFPCGTLWVHSLHVCMDIQTRHVWVRIFYAYACILTFVLLCILRALLCSFLYMVLYVSMCMCVRVCAVHFYVRECAQGTRLGKVNCVCHLPTWASSCLHPLDACISVHVLYACMHAWRRVFSLHSLSLSLMVFPFTCARIRRVCTCWLCASERFCFTRAFCSFPLGSC